jgi:hypothetical protein
MPSKRKKLVSKSWAEIAKSIRKPMPPPTKVDKKLTAYNRKKAKAIPNEDTFL